MLSTPPSLADSAKPEGAESFPGVARRTPGADGVPVRLPPAEALVYSIAEEIANSITHGLGVLLAIAGLAGLVARGVAYGSSRYIVAGAVYGVTLILLYGASTLYHAIPLPRAKRFFRILDHACIYLLIAGTYTPFTLVTLRGAWGWGLFGAIWGLATVGVVFKIFFTGRFTKLSTMLYVTMGWCLVVAIKPLRAGLAASGMALLVAGGLAYTLGVYFYANKKLPYGHAVWHALVLLGSVLHYLAILLYVVP